jgi:cyanuric acid amidohydrolase
VPDAIEVRKVPLHSVADASGLATLIDDGVIEADRVVAVIGKTEGNGGVNDYTRIIADRAFREVLVAKGTRDAAAVREIPIVWSGGTDGVLSPHATVFATVPEAAGRTQRRAPARGRIRDERGTAPRRHRRSEMIRKVADAVQVAMKRAGITDAGDVHYVQTKTPLLTIDTIREARSRGHDVFTEDTLASMDVSNGTTALGIAVALGEIAMPRDSDVLRDRRLYSVGGVVLVGRGARPGPGRRRRQRARRRRPIPHRHSVMADALDSDGIWAAVRNAGLDLPDRPHPSDLGGRLVNVFLKCEASQDGQVRDAATPCSTTPTCTGIARSRPASAESRQPSPATRRSSCPCPRLTRARTAAVRSPRSSTWAESRKR